MNQKAYSVVSLPDVIVIGRRTETGVLEVRFDCTSWLSYWPKLSLSLWITPPKGSAAYPATTRMSGKELVWTVNSADTAVEGFGSLEIVGKATGQKKLSAIAKTQVLHTTTTTTTTPPEAAQGWVDQVLDAATNAENAVGRAAAEVGKAKAEVAKAEGEVAKAKAYAEEAKENALGAVTWDDVQNKPTTMPNPYPLVLNGQEYDGSKEIEVTIEANGGTADTVPWTGVTGKPSTFPPESHTHSEYATTGALSQLSAQIANMLTVSTIEINDFSDVVLNEVRTFAATPGKYFIILEAQISGEKGGEWSLSLLASPNLDLVDNADVNWKISMIVGISDVVSNIGLMFKKLPDNPGRFKITLLRLA